MAQYYNVGTNVRNAPQFDTRGLSKSLSDVNATLNNMLARDTALKQQDIANKRADAQLGIQQANSTINLAKEADRVKEAARVANDRKALQSYTVDPNRVQGQHRNLYDTAVEQAYAPTTDITKQHQALLDNEALTQQELESKTDALYRPSVDTFSTKFEQLAPLQEDVQAQVYRDLKSKVSDPATALAAAKIEASPFSDKKTIQDMLAEQAKVARENEKNRVAGVKNLVDVYNKMDKDNKSGGSYGASIEEMYSIVDSIDPDDTINFIGPEDSDRIKNQIAIRMAKIDTLPRHEQAKAKNILKGALLEQFGSYDIDMNELDKKIVAGDFDQYATGFGSSSTGNLKKFIGKLSKEGALDKVLTERTINTPTVTSYLQQRQKDVLGAGASNNLSSSSTEPSLADKLKRTAANGSGSDTTVNVANNNPGNIKISQDDWKGNKGDDGTFVKFESPEMGVRAMVKDLTTKIKRGDNTLAKIIPQWAPAEDKNNPASYIKSVSDATGISPDQPLTEADMFHVIKEMTRIEGGSDSLKTFSDDVIVNGLAKAGIAQYSPSTAVPKEVKSKVDQPKPAQSTQNDNLLKYRGDTSNIPQTFSELIGLPNGTNISDIVPTGTESGETPNTIGEMLYGKGNRLDSFLDSTYTNLSNLATGNTDMQRQSREAHEQDRRRQAIVKEINTMPMSKLTSLPVESLQELAKSPLPEETRQRVVKALDYISTRR